MIEVRIRQKCYCNHGALGADIACEDCQGTGWIYEWMPLEKAVIQAHIEQKRFDEEMMR